VKINVFFAHIEIELVAVLLMGQRLSTRGDVYTVVNDVHFATHQNPSTTLMRLLRWTHRQRDRADSGDRAREHIARLHRPDAFRRAGRTIFPGSIL